jgi:hydroxymethylpyrimidine/phosphomethylpyrimidine kinase
MILAPVAGGNPGSMTNQGESADNLRLRGRGASETDTPPLGADPVLLVAIGGLDPSGGAGVVRDLLTARTFCARVRVVPTAWTEQSPGAGVSSVEPRDPARLEEAVAAAWRTAAREGLPVAVKVGMLPDARAAGAILAALGGDGVAGGPRASGLGPREGPTSREAPPLTRPSEARSPKPEAPLPPRPRPEARGPKPEAPFPPRPRAPFHQPTASFAGPFVLDPVLGASSGGALFRGEPAELLPLLARATLVTPNVPEAAALLGLSASDIRTLDDVERAGRALLDAGARAVLVKGGHLPAGGTGTGAGDSVDTLVTATGTQRFAASRHPGPDVRGTGCALATAIAVGLGRGLPLEAAIAGAKEWLRGALERAVARDGEWHID